ncbi:MAG: hypothetical protein DRG78_01770 [Epsilonproteobacteria bacterium]|nr:MAG: hypothetical protein DRG78_01770 [Campylobacterota bacterium]
MNTITLNKLAIYTPTIDTLDSTKVNQEINKNYYIDNYIHFSILMNNNNTIWKYGNLYLLYKIKEYHLPETTTIDSLLSNLKIFKEWIDTYDIQYLMSPTRKILGPIYQYRKHLNTLINEAKIKPATATNRMSTVISFYKFLVDIEGIYFQYPLYEKKFTSFKYIDSLGFKNSKEVERTDVGYFKNTKAVDYKGESIKDGSNLIPIKLETQEKLIKILIDSKNIEMRLGFFLALTTGARIQSVFTLRLEHFKRIASDDENKVKIKIGDGTLCDTKRGKQHILFVPKYIYNMIQIYIQSPRAKNRRNTSTHIFDNEDKYYLFLSNRGAPFYCAKNDPYRYLYNIQNNGNTVRQFIATTLKKEFKIHYNINYKHSFHDLRATYIMNIYDSKIELVNKGIIKLSSLLHEMKEYAGHESIITTERYMDFRDRNKETENIQNDYENKLMIMITE